MEFNFPQRLPDIFLHFFEADDGEIFKQECTEEEYRALGLEGAGSPKFPVELNPNKKWRWNHSGSYAQWDTTSKVLENGDAYEDEYGIMYVDDSGSHIRKKGMYNLNKTNANIGDVTWL